MTTLLHYSPEDIIFVFGGVHEVTGFVDGSFINISKDESSFNTSVTADGLPTRVRSSNSLFTISLTLHSASESNQVLSYALTLDEATKMGKFPIIIKDRLGSSLFFSPTTWIESRPDSEWSTDVTEREWMFKCYNGTFNVGSNDSPTGMTEDLLNAALGLAGTFL